MILSIPHPRRYAACALLLLPTLACAQQQPLTGRMMTPASGASVAAPATPAPVAAPSPSAATPASTRASAPTPASIAASHPASQLRPLPPSVAPAQAAEPAPIASAAPLAPPPAEPLPPMDDAGAHSQIGQTVRGLWQLQASNNRPGRQRSITGDEASAAYKRYLKSFEHEIPDLYESRVGSTNGGGGGMGGLAAGSGSGGQ